MDRSHDAFGQRQRPSLSQAMHTVQTAGDVLRPTRRSPGVTDAFVRRNAMEADRRISDSGLRHDAKGALTWVVGGVRISFGPSDPDERPLRWGPVNLVRA